MTTFTLTEPCAPEEVKFNISQEALDFIYGRA